MFTYNDEDTTNREEFTKYIQYINDSPYTNPMPFITAVYTQKQITYKHPYTLFVPSLTPQYTSSRYANRKNCLFYVNLTFDSNNYVWNSDELFNMSINL